MKLIPNQCYRSKKSLVVYRYLGPSSTVHLEIFKVVKSSHPFARVDDEVELFASFVHKYLRPNLILVEGEDDGSK